jgi:purine-binding chemotaxis protein CheW
MSGASAAVLAENRLTLASFEAAGRCYALDVAQLREIVRWRPPTPLPGAPGLIEGVIDLRGTLVPVIDLAGALGVQGRGAGARSRIAVAEIDGLVVGLAVDAALEVLSVEAGALGDPPALATQAGYALARAVVRRPGAEPVPLLSLEHVLERVYRSSLPEAEGLR